MNDKSPGTILNEWKSKFEAADDEGKLDVWAEMCETFAATNTMVQNMWIIKEMHRLYHLEMRRAVDKRFPE